MVALVVIMVVVVVTIVVFVVDRLDQPTNADQQQIVSTLFFYLTD